MATLVGNVCKKERKYCGRMMAYDALKSLLHQTQKRKTSYFAEMKSPEDLLEEIFTFDLEV